MTVTTTPANQCTICLDPFQTGRSYTINCEYKDNHADRVHKACAKRWLREKQTCPTCRGPVVDLSNPIILISQSKAQKVSDVASAALIKTCSAIANRYSYDYGALLTDHPEYGKNAYLRSELVRLAIQQIQIYPESARGYEALLELISRGVHDDANFWNWLNGEPDAFFSVLDLSKGNGGRYIFTFNHVKHEEIRRRILSQALAQRFPGSSLLDAYFRRFRESQSFGYLNAIREYACRGKREAFESLQKIVTFDNQDLRQEALVELLLTLDFVITRNASRPFSVQLLIAPVFAKYMSIYRQGNPNDLLSALKRIADSVIYIYDSYVPSRSFSPSSQHIADPQWQQGTILMARYSNGTRLKQYIDLLDTVYAEIRDSESVYPSLLSDLVSLCFQGELGRKLAERWIKELIVLSHKLNLFDTHIASYSFAKELVRHPFYGRDYYRLYESKLELMNVVLEYGANPNGATEDDDETLFQLLYRHFLSSNSFTSRAEGLQISILANCIQNGANLLDVSSNGETFMSRLIQVQNQKCIERLSQFDHRRRANSLL